MDFDQACLFGRITPAGAADGIDHGVQARLRRAGAVRAVQRVGLPLALGLLILLFTRALLTGQLLSGFASLESPPRLAEFAKVIADHLFPPIWAPDLSNGHG